MLLGLGLDTVEVNQCFPAILNHLEVEARLLSSLNLASAHQKSQQQSLSVGETHGGGMGNHLLHFARQHRLLWLHLAVPVVLDGVVGPAWQEA